MRRRLPILLVALAGCALVPRPNHFLDEARASYELGIADPGIAAHAPLQLAKAAELLQQAGIAHARLDDPAVVDHLAYLAKRQVEIAREVARLGSEEARR